MSQNLSQILKDYPPDNNPEAPDQSKRRTRSTPLEDSPYPPEWIINSNLVHRTICRFEREYIPAVEEPHKNDLPSESIDASEAPRKSCPQTLIQQSEQPTSQPSAQIPNTRPPEQPLSQLLAIMAGLSDEQFRVISTAVAAAMASAQQADCAAYPTLTSYGFRA
ncbi:MAG: hypothetical protein FRX48_02252 [Lasallia pustulata]|uniref:Uncharacterized protein n=1 Tax=Lasallia pustulata TaxID=136370 RepID=A0A5M8PYY1_9LECA|nr:MAG: hypothetical protein FRX48_02252 [Lasallia pustulata]